MAKIWVLGYMAKLQVLSPYNHIYLIIKQKVLSSYACESSFFFSFFGLIFYNWILNVCNKEQITIKHFELFCSGELVFQHHFKLYLCIPLIILGCHLALSMIGEKPEDQCLIDAM